MRRHAERDWLGVPASRRMGRVRRLLPTLLGALIVLAAFATSAGASPPDLPLLIDPGTTVAQQYGYTPAYPCNVPGFDSSSLAYIRSRTAAEDDTSFIASQGDGVWLRHDILQTLRDAYPDFAGTIGAGGYFSAQVVFDIQDRAYTVLTVRTSEGEFHNVMLYSLDRCLTWKVVELPLGDNQACFDGKNLGNVACEHFTGHNPLDGPPFVAVWRTIAPWPGPWADRNALYVLQPYFEGDELRVPQAAFVTDKFEGMLQCAGDSSFAATLGNQTFFTYTNVVDPRLAGSPTYVGVFDRTTGKVVRHHLVARSYPHNDCHTSAAICLDSHGYLHVVTGAHRKPFNYTHSLLPSDITAWTAAQPVLSSGFKTAGSDKDGYGQQTYASLVCDGNDVLQLVFRQTRQGIDPWLGRKTCRALCIQSRPSFGRWSPPRMLAAGVTEAGYVNFYQHLAISPSGRFFLAFCYYTHALPVPLREFRRFPRRILLASDDGVSWRFAGDADLAPAAF